MAQLIPLALGALGSSIGAKFGLSALGFAVGSAIGQQLIAPDPTVEGPRLDDLNNFDSAYGKPIPKVWGTMQVAGNVIWATDPILFEDTWTTREGGGTFSKGVKVRHYSYYATFAVLICEGEIDAVTKIWLDDTLLYDLSDSASVDNVIASDDIENVITIYKGTETQTADPTIESVEGAGNAPGYRGRAYIVFNQLNVDDYGGVPKVTVEVIKNSSKQFNTHTGDKVDSSVEFNRACNDVDADTATLFVGQWNTSTYTGLLYYYDVLKNGKIKYAGSLGYANWGSFGSGISDVPCILYKVRGSSAYEIMERSGKIRPVYVGASIGGTQIRFYRKDSDLWITSTITSASIYRLRLYSNGYFLEQQSASVPTDPSSIDIYGSSLYVLSNNSIYVYDSDSLSLTNTIALSSSAASGATMRVEDEDSIYVWSSSNLNHYDGSGNLLSSESLPYAPGAAPQPSFGMFSEDAFRLVTNSPTIGYSTIAYNTISDAGSSLDDVVTDICDDSSIDSSLIDVSDLAGYTVDGYSVSRPMPGRNAIKPLQQAYWFDVAEFGGKINFVSRGGATADTIPEDDLGATYGDGIEAFVSSRIQDADLPRRVTVKHLDPDLDGQQNTQYAARITTQATAEQMIELPLLLGSDSAAQIAEVILYDAWQTREPVKFSIPAENYYQINPTDIVSVTHGDRTYSIRLTRIDFELPGVMNCEGVIENASVYSPVATGHAPSTQTDTINLSGPTVGRILDIALIDDLDDPAGFYVAATGYMSGWRGCAFMMSTDGGASYDIMTIISDRTVIGIAGTALPSGEDAVIDNENSLTVSLARDDDSLSGITQAQLLNLSNLALVGDEIIAFQNAANTIGSEWDIDTFLRSQRGTDWANDGHSDNEEFMLLDNVVRIPLSDDHIGSEIYYKFVTLGHHSDSVDAQSFTYQGNAYKPYSVTHLEAEDAGSGNWDISWVRRTRVGGAWRDYVDASLSEDSESYTVEVWSGGSLSTSTDVTSESATVSASSGDTVIVYQNSATVGKGYPAEVTIP